MHAVAGAPKLVAKIYLKPPDAAKVEKLRLMIRGQSPGLLGVAAWPVELLTDERGAVRGFLMGRISARQDAHRLYSPKSRRRTFPDADFRFVVRAATNLARAFGQIHAAGHVIGDVNHGNALIGKDGTAVLIDCDSIQVRERTRNRFYTCDVGTPLFTPPELQGKAFRGLKRTEASDRFGLSVLIFHLLFQGRHPFAGIYADGEMPLERAIAESRFAYGAHAESLGMLAPPGTLPLTAFGRPIARLFERAFAPPGGEEERPSAIEWIDELRDLEQRLTACPRRPRHFHPRGDSCCWCDVELRTGAKLFEDGQTANAESDAVTAQQLWQAIEGVQPPKPAELPDFAAEELRAINATSIWTRFAEALAQRAPPLLFGGILVASVLSLAATASVHLLFLGVMSAVAIAAVSFSKRTGNSRLRRAMRIEWQNAIAQWRNHSSAGLFSGARSQLEQARRSLGILAEQQREELERLERLLEPRQHEAYLDAFEIDKALFLAVLPAHIDQLAIRGIRTAGDIRRHRGMVQRLVPAESAAELRNWALQCALGFKFDKLDPTYLADAAKVENSYRQKRHQYLAELRRGPELLATRRDEVANARARAEGVLRRKHEDLRKRREEQKQ
ncbi:MAG: hypothetical protein ABW106_11195 [Steroidobacteraceae bacterium]